MSAPADQISKSQPVRRAVYALLAALLTMLWLSTVAFGMTNRVERGMFVAMSIAGIVAASVMLWGEQKRKWKAGFIATARSCIVAMLVVSAIGAIPAPSPAEAFGYYFGQSLLLTFWITATAWFCRNAISPRRAG